MHRDRPPLDKRQYLRMPVDPKVLKYESPNFGKLYGIQVAKAVHENRERDMERQVKTKKEKDDANRLTKALKMLVRKSAKAPWNKETEVKLQDK